ncbi:hypothetical protein CTV99_07300 [Bacillus pumilus]|uniref:Uncharacterized protein n=1 Tax=Bacillus pumilus TaxID=1408 RepID=A0A2G8IVS7_BACPU|nr:hypothetical protein CTV99_07300 [Bacillus pumilus]
MNIFVAAFIYKPIFILYIFDAFTLMSLKKLIRNQPPISIVSLIQKQATEILKNKSAPKTLI